jgi:hypothetical protein
MIKFMNLNLNQNNFFIYQFENFKCLKTQVKHFNNHWYNLYKSLDKIEQFEVLEVHNNQRCLLVDHKMRMNF